MIESSEDKSSQSQLENSVSHPEQKINFVNPKISSNYRIVFVNKYKKVENQGKQVLAGDSKKNLVKCVLTYAKHIYDHHKHKIYTRHLCQ